MHMEPYAIQFLQSRDVTLHNQSQETVHWNYRALDLLIFKDTDKGPHVWGVH